MARRYEFPDAAWALILDLVSPEQRMGRPRSDGRRSMASSGTSAQVQPGATCQSGSAHGRRSISAFVTCGTLARSSKYLSVCTSD